MEPEFLDEDLLGAELFAESLMGQLLDVSRPAGELEGPLKREFFAALKRTPNYRCFAPRTPPCDEAPIDAHSLHRASVLRFLGGESGHVITFETVPRRDAPITEAQAKRVGIQRASVFRGMCDRHDTEVFAPIESGVMERPTSAQLVLLAYRAALKQHHQQWRDLVWSEALDQAARALAMHPRFVISYFSNCVNDKKRCYEAGRATLEGLYAAVRRGRAGRELVSVHRFVRPLGFATAAMFSPIVDVRGDLVWATEKPATAFLNVLPTDRGTLIAVSVERRSRLKLQNFLSDFGRARDERFIEMAWEFALAHTNNTFLSEAAWAALGGREQRRTLDYWSATHGLQHTPWPNLPVPGM